MGIYNFASCESLNMGSCYLTLNEYKVQLPVEPWGMRMQREHTTLNDILDGIKLKMKLL